MSYFFYNPQIENNIYDLSFFVSLFECGDFHASPTISFVNPYSYKLLKNNYEVCKKVDYWFADGGLLCKLVNIGKEKKINRVSFDFSSIADYVFTLSARKQYRVAIVGGNEEDISKFVSCITGSYKNLNICYCRNGYFNDQSQSEVHREISDSEPDIVIVGLGTPLQEEFIVSLRPILAKQALLITCGGFITQTKMRKDFYHPIIKKLGLRWAQRAIQQKHVRQRLIKDYPPFVLGYFADKTIIRLKDVIKIKHGHTTT